MIKKTLMAIALTSLTMTAFSAEQKNEWTGPYAGVHIGYADGEDKGKETYTDGNPETWHVETSPSNVLFGASAGFNKKFDNNFLLGFEADIDRRNAKDLSYQIDGTSAPDHQYPVEINIKNAASLRVRLGYVLNQDKTLLYVTGGAAFADIHRKFTDTTKFSVSDSSWQTGWTAGLGAEHFFADKISAKVEYRYSDYGRKTIDSSAMYGDDPGIDFERQEYKNENSIRLGVAYHF